MFVDANLQRYHMKLKCQNILKTIRQNFLFVYLNNPFGVQNFEIIIWKSVFKTLRRITSCSLMSVEMITEYKVSTKCVPVDMISMTNVLLLYH